MKRLLGQHFLKNKAAIKKIVAALDLEENDTVIEIGPGHGELTQELSCHPINIIAIEKDVALANKLAEKFKIVQGDALKELPKLINQLKTKSYKLVGNIPFYITGHLLRVISELENKPTITVLTIQKEVAKRIVAQPPKMNRLAASVQIWAGVEIIAHIPAQDFDPPPAVDSVVVRLKTKDHSSIYDREYLSKYYCVAKMLFQQPRKTVLNNLSAGLKISKEDLLKKLGAIGLSGGERPQNLSIDQIAKTAKALSTI